MARKISTNFPNTKLKDTTATVPPAMEHVVIAMLYAPQLLVEVYRTAIVSPKPPTWSILV
jgi:hypothetical protein